MYPGLLPQALIFDGLLTGRLLVSGLWAFPNPVLAETNPKLVLRRKNGPETTFLGTPVVVLRVTHLPSRLQHPVW